jgi:hypothetical protein
MFISKKVLEVIQWNDLLNYTFEYKLMYSTLITNTVIKTGNILVLLSKKNVHLWEQKL